MDQAGRHLYIHVPFCDGKCAYCGFYSEVYSPDGADRYLDALDREFDLRLGQDQPASETIYCGGGTPSILAPAQLSRLCRLIRRHIAGHNLREWSVEANPGTLPAEKLGVLRDAGVNRISIGAQSFDDAVLTDMSRRHTAAAIRETARAVRAAGIDNVGLDLIAGLPDVNGTLWRNALMQAIELDPRHISVYALTIEHACRLAAPHEDTQIRAIEEAESILTAAGYVRYEISNYAKPGFEAKHNVSCWRGEDYLGFGPAAASRAGLKRWSNKPSIKDYADALAAGQLPLRDEESVTPETDAAERLVFAFRLAEGVDLARFAAMPGNRIESWTNALARLAAEGLTKHEGDRWFLTRRGRDLADFVAGRLIG